MATNPQRRAGFVELKVDGEMQDAKGDFEYNLGAEKREPVVGTDAVHGYKATPQVPFIKGAITDKGTLDLRALVTGTGLTVNLTVGNGKMFVLRDAWYAGDGNVNTDEAEIEVEWHGLSAEEV